MNFRLMLPAVSLAALMVQAPTVLAQEAVQMPSGARAVSVGVGDLDLSADRRSELAGSPVLATAQQPPAPAPGVAAPIQIAQPPAQQAPAAAYPTASYPQPAPQPGVQPAPAYPTHYAPPPSPLGGVRPMSMDEAQAMMNIMGVIDRTNAASPDFYDDPLYGLTPEQRAYMEATRGHIPMTPEQISAFKHRYQEVLEAERAPVLKDAVPISRSIDLSLVPGEALPVLRMRAGHVSTLTFSDRNGNSWPILSVTPGNASAFDANTAGPQGNTNILVVNTRQNWAVSNMVVTLVGHPVPILLTLDAREPEYVDFRVDIRVDARGPNSAQPTEQTYALQAPTNDSTMITFLDGVAPKGAQRLKTNSRDVDAWVYKDQMYLRTRGQVMSPAYHAKTSNVSGLNVFAMNETPVVVLTTKGVIQHISINR